MAEGDQLEDKQSILKQLTDLDPDKVQMIKDLLEAVKANDSREVNNGQFICC